MKRILIKLIGVLLMICFGVWVADYSEKNIVNDDSGVDTIINYDPVLTNTDNNENKEPVKVNNGKKLSCYDFINTLLEKDGFAHLEGSKWGRGEKDFFIVDLDKKEFQMADPYHLEALPENWYSTEYEKYINTTYRHSTQSVDAFGYDGTNSYVIFTNGKESILEPTSAFQEFPEWMEYYINQSQTFGCSIVGEFNEGTMETYKTQLSTTTAEGVISVFDVKSTDGVIRYFNDVYVEGDVKDNPRYRELQSFEELYEVKGEDGFEITLLISIINSDKNKTFDSNSGNIQANVIEEFVKDVVYPFVPERNDAKYVETLGIYFIDVDNPNGNFKSLYKSPVKGAYYSSDRNDTFSDLRDLSIPFEGTVVETEKSQRKGFAYTPFSVHSIEHVLKEYLKNVVFINPDVSFSDDFIRNYTRPFAYEWQKQMGLTELFDEKYGFVDHSIKYMN